MNSDADSEEGDGGRDLEQEQLAKLQGLSLEQVARLAHEATFRLLTARVAAGTITHQEMAILRNMLRDNGLVWNLSPPPLDGEAAKTLPNLDELPALEKPDYE
ncbi:vacuolar-type H+-ATPase subunit C/Vma6 [Rhodoblastus acidophilus]|uniref:hypothetical protein n=1 Tax=Rhodoblastus acidophilus TaxID=1074 RepID=UPI002225A8AD|nr:hypothetical protein [Rhodoblastus acidophilus]MCW2317146.1 vacuolar-type H+-ATPase subunit C/Vma6 [Rhodoblastus acidophilus]